MKVSKRTVVPPLFYYHNKRRKKSVGHGENIGKQHTSRLK